MLRIWILFLVAQAFILRRVLPSETAFLKRDSEQQPPLRWSLSLQYCCRYAEDPAKLLACVRGASTNATDFIDARHGVPVYESNLHSKSTEDAPYPQLPTHEGGDSAGGPSLRLAMVTYATSEITNYSAYSFAINLAYAQHNGYSLLYLDDNSGANYEPTDARWNKVKILEQALLSPSNRAASSRRSIRSSGGEEDILLQGWASTADYLIWLDADLVILDFNLRIEQLATAYPHAHILACAGR